MGPIDETSLTVPETTPAKLDIEGYLADSTAELRRCAGESWYAEAIDGQGQPMPIVLGYHDVRAVLRDRSLSPRSFTDDMIAGGLSVETAQQLTPFFRRHGDDHRNFRGLLGAAFTPRQVELMRPVAADIATRLADAIAANGGHCEFVSDFAEPLPPELFAALFGLPSTDRDRLATWAATVATAFSPMLSEAQLVGIEAAAAELRDWSADLIRERRREPSDDLITHLIDAEVDGERLDDVDIIAVITGFVFAGSETTKRQLTQLIVAFAEHPENWRRVAADPELIANAIEEVMRHRPIVTGLTRVAITPFEHNGLEVGADGRAVVSIETANHDAAAFDDPDTFDVSRPGADGHVTFGWGPHFCIGAGLARVEMQEALRALVTHFDPPTLTDLVPSEVPSGFGGPDQLAVTFALRRSPS